MTEFTNIEYIAFEDEQGNEIEMQIIDEFEHDENRYIALCPIPNDFAAPDDNERVQFFAITIDDEQEEDFQVVENKALLNTLGEILEERLMKR